MTKTTFSTFSVIKNLNLIPFSHLMLGNDNLSDALTRLYAIFFTRMID